MNYTCSLSKVLEELHQCNLNPADSLASRIKTPLARFEVQS